MGTCFSVSPVTAGDSLHEWGLQWPRLLPGHVQKVPRTPSFWEAIRALLAKMTVMTNSTMTENVPQINFKPIFQALACAHAVTWSAPVHVHLPRTPTWGWLWLEERTSNTVLNSEQELESQFLSKQLWRWTRLKLWPLSQQDLTSLVYTDTNTPRSVHIMRKILDRTWRISQEVVVLIVFLWGDQLTSSDAKVVWGKSIFSFLPELEVCYELNIIC